MKLKVRPLIKEPYPRDRPLRHASQKRCAWPNPRALSYRRRESTREPTTRPEECDGSVDPCWMAMTTVPGPARIPSDTCSLCYPEIYRVGFPLVPTEDLTLKNAGLGLLVFLFNSVVLVPFAAALLCSFPKDRRLSRTWDIVVLAVGLISLFVGGCAILFRADSERRLCQDCFFFSTYVPIIIAGAGASLGSCLLLRTTAG